jgi:uncharacterized membrane protein
MIVLAYLWLLALVPLLLAKDDPEVQWHARHGIVLTLAELAVLLGYTLLLSLVSLAALPVGGMLSLLLVGGWIAVLVLHVAAIVKGTNGGRLLVPFVSGYAGSL